MSSSVAKTYWHTIPEWRAKNPEKVKAAAKRSHAKHREERLIKMRIYYERNKERLSAKHREYILANPEVARLRKHRYRARLANGTGPSFTVKQWRVLLAQFEGRCGYCGAEANSADHRLPISRGGANTIDNIIPACRACNSRKRHRTEEEFRAILTATGH